MKERWKNIKGCPDYQISDYGRIKSLKFQREKILRCSEGEHGSRFIKLRVNNKYTSLSVAQLVASHFIREMKDDETIEFKDNDNSNLYYSNLRIRKNNLGTGSRIYSVHKLINRIELEKDFANKTKESSEFKKGMIMMADLIIDAIIDEKTAEEVHSDQREKELEELLKQTCINNSVAISEVKSKSRKADLVSTRVEFANLAFPRFSHDEIAKILNKERSSIYHYFK